MNATIKEKFKKEWSSIVKVEPLLFASFVPLCYPGGDTTKKPYQDVYCELYDRDKVKKAAENGLDDYNGVNHSKRMHLVLFTSAIEHVVKIHRIVTTEFGHALLIGVGGSGRKSSTTLASYTADYTLFQVEISKAYGLNEWHDDMKSLLIKSGADGMNMVFLFPDTQMSNETFLEEVSSVLNTGEVPNLYANEDKMEIIEKCSKLAAQEGKTGTNEVFSWYVDTCRKNLHIVLAMSPIGAAFRNRLRNFPSLVNCCTIDWFQEWPPEALAAVADSFLKEIDIEEELKQKVVKVMVSQQVVATEVTEAFLNEQKRHYYITPTSYLELVSSFLTMLKQQRHIVQQAKWRYDVGLEKIADAASQVAALQKDLEDLQPVLEKAAKETSDMM
jgi:dynein heavy chain